MMTIVLATRNKKKVEELTRMFSGYAIRFLTLDSFPSCPEVVEDGETFRENALKKAIHVSRFTGCPSIADDSGLEVPALGGAPGVLSARYAGEGADDRMNVRKLLKNMANLRGGERGARFVCCIAFALPDGKYKTFKGDVKGTIGKKPRGFNGFGYDPIFFPAGSEKTFAEMADTEKDAMSHRGNAMRKLYAYLRNLL
jgi:XTP/dITP diphosphohydrolase